MDTSQLPPLPPHVEYLEDEHVKFYTDMGYKCVLRVNGEVVAIQPLTLSTQIK